jgi:hypothetical protein
MFNYLRSVLFLMLYSNLLWAANNQLCLREDAYLKEGGKPNAGITRLSCNTFYQDIVSVNSELVQLGMDSLTITGATKLGKEDFFSYRKLKPKTHFVIVDFSSVYSEDNAWCSRVEGPLSTLMGGLKGIPSELLQGHYVLSSQETAYLLLEGGYELLDLDKLDLKQGSTSLKKSKNVVVYSSGSKNIRQLAKNNKILMSQGIFFTDARYVEIDETRKNLLLIKSKRSSIPKRYKCN